MKKGKKKGKLITNSTSGGKRERKKIARLKRLGEENQKKARLYTSNRFISSQKKEREIFCGDWISREGG